METKHLGSSEHRRLGPSQIGLSSVLASLCRFANLDWSRLSDFRQVPAAADHCVSRPALAAMLSRARDRRGYGPFLLAVLAASGILLGKFALDSRPTVYVAIGVLAVASLWNTWPRHDTSNDATACSNCGKQEIP